MRSSDVISGKSPEEFPPKFRRKLPVPMPQWAGQVSPCNDVSRKFWEADVRVMLPAAEPWDKLRNEVDSDPHVAMGAAQRCFRAHKAGLPPFTLERPGNSIAREPNSWKELVVTGCFILDHHHCMFLPCLDRSSKSFSPIVTLLHISRQGCKDVEFALTPNLRTRLAHTRSRTAK